MSFLIIFLSVPCYKAYPLHLLHLVLLLNTLKPKRCKAGKAALCLAPFYPHLMPPPFSPLCVSPPPLLYCGLTARDLDVSFALSWVRASRLINGYEILSLLSLPIHLPRFLRIHELLLHSSVSSSFAASLIVLRHLSLHCMHTYEVSLKFYLPFMHMCDIEREPCVFEVYFYVSWKTLQKDRRAEKDKAVSGKQLGQETKSEAERAERKENKRAKNIHLHLWVECHTVAVFNASVQTSFKCICHFVECCLV